MIAGDSLMYFSQEFLDPGLINKISEQENLSLDDTKSCLKSVVFTLYKAITETGSTPEGAGNILDLSNSHHFTLQNSPLAEICKDTEAVKKIFGKDQNELISILEVKTAIEKEKIKHFMNFVTNQLLAIMCSKIKKENLDIMGLMHFLSGENNVLDRMGVRIH